MRDGRGSGASPCLCDVVTSEQEIAISVVDREVSKAVVFITVVVQLDVIDDLGHSGERARRSKIEQIHGPHELPIAGADPLALGNTANGRTVVFLDDSSPG